MRIAVQIIPLLGKDVLSNINRREFHHVHPENELTHDIVNHWINNGIVNYDSHQLLRCEAEISRLLAANNNIPVLAKQPNMDDVLITDQQWQTILLELGPCYINPDEHPQTTLCLPQGRCSFRTHDHDGFWNRQQDIPINTTTQLM